MPSEMNECSNGDITFELVRFANRELLSTASQRTITLDLDTPVLEMGILDSLSMVSLLTFVQTTLGVVIPDEKVLPENFETLGTLADLITQLQLSGRPVHEGVAECALLQSIRILEPAGIRRRWLPVDGDAQIHALEISGPAPGWVLLPGLGNPSSSWGAVLKSLRGQNAALAPDFLGFGVSRSERLAPDYTAQVRAIREAIDTAAVGSGRELRRIAGRRGDRTGNAGQGKGVGDHRLRSGRRSSGVAHHAHQAFGIA